MKSLLLIFSFFLIGCVSRVVPLRHQYLPGIFEQVVTKPKAVVWANLLNFLSQNQIAVRVSDSATGLLKSGQTALPWSYESKGGGKLNDPEAWVAVERVIYKNKPLTLTSIVGEWNIRVKELDAGRTYIVVNLVDLRYSTPSEPTYQPFLRASPRSTGVFERMLADQLK